MNTLRVRTLGFRMFNRSLLRDVAAGIVAATGLVGTIAASHAQVAFWPHIKTDGRAQQAQTAGGWQMASVRAESRDHVQAQIDRMEARARADDRLSGRPGNGGRDEAQARAHPQERTSQSESSRAEPRSTGVGPGWQVRGSGR